MAIEKASPTGPAAVLTADAEALSSVASRVDDLADRLSTCGPSRPAVLPAVVPQAARLAAVLAQARGRQTDRLAGFAGFYRTSAAALTATARGLAATEEDSVNSFRTLHAGSVG
ncbi:hypothetical protein PQI66_07590 [Corynebacterium sp. USCH3]|uniref:hypothetical protein n=1 Tax=Corynebacterium sp. USCH3 TaxID=3024840 RepID=UPI0030AE2203